MTGRAIIQGSFCDYKNVKTRSVVQLIIEVPSENARMAFDALGIPVSGTEIPVAIALLDPKAVQKKVDKERRRFNELPLPQQAALRCQDEAFCRFLAEEKNAYQLGDGFADFVRHYCGVASRSEIQPGTPAANKWRDLNNEFQAWMAAG